MQSILFVGADNVITTHILLRPRVPRASQTVDVPSCRADQSVSLHTCKRSQGRANTVFLAPSRSSRLPVFSWFATLLPSEFDRERTLDSAHSC